MIKLESVWKIYDSNQPALADVDLQVETGEFLFLTGPSGAGKSTLLRLIFRAETATRGNVFVNGLEVGGMRQRDIPALRRQIGVVFQDFKLLPRRTVFENVALAARISGHSYSVQTDRAMRVLRRVVLDHKADCYPQQLSGGEQQRVALARAVVNDPPILLADEPTGNLDPDLSVEMIELFKQVNNRGTTVIVASHDRSLISRFPRRVLGLDAGKLVKSVGEGRPFYRKVAEEAAKRRHEIPEADPVAGPATAPASAPAGPEAP